MDIEKAMQFIVDTQARLSASFEQSKEEMKQRAAENEKRLALNEKRFALNEKAMDQSRERIDQVENLLIRLARVTTALADKVERHEEANRKDHEDFMERANVTLKIVDDLIRRREGGLDPA